MNRKNNCIACRYKEDGVKTRRALVHTCGKYNQYTILASNKDQEIFFNEMIDPSEPNDKLKQGFWTYITHIFKKKPHN